MSGAISTSSLTINLTADWNTQPNGLNVCPFTDIKVVDSSGNILGDDPGGDELWRINVQPVTPAYQPTFTLQFNLLNAPTAGSAVGWLRFKVMNVAPVIAETTDPFGAPLPSQYNLNVELIAGGGPFALMSAPITNGGDWAWAAAFNVTALGQTKYFFVDPEMEVGDLGSPG